MQFCVPSWDMAVCHSSVERFAGWFFLSRVSRHFGPCVGVDDSEETTRGFWPSHGNDFSVGGEFVCVGVSMEGSLIRDTHVVARVQKIVGDACALKNTHTSEQDAPVNYACVFAQSDYEYEALLEEIQKLGKVVKDTKMGPVFLVEPIETVAGPVRLVKIRKPDPQHTERGDADFTVADYPTFKSSVLGKPGYKLIERPDMEMIELSNPAFNVLAYFSHPPLIETLGIKW